MCQERSCDGPWGAWVWINGLCSASRACTTMPGARCGSMVNTGRILAWELECIRALSLAHCSSSWCWKRFCISSALVCPLQDLMLKPAGPLMDPYFHLSIHCILIVFYCGGRGDRTAAKYLQYIPRNMHTVFALLCFVVVIHWLIFPYPSGLLHWHCGNLTIAPVPAKQPWWIWINTSCEFIMNDCITTTKQSTTKPCAYFLGYTVLERSDPSGHFQRHAWKKNSNRQH